MGDNFVDVDEHDPYHWRYWTKRVKGADREATGGEFQVQTNDGWVIINSSQYPGVTSEKMAAVWASQMARNEGWF